MARDKSKEITLYQKRRGLIDALVSSALTPAGIKYAITKTSDDTVYSIRFDINTRFIVLQFVLNQTEIEYTDVALFKSMVLLDSEIENESAVISNTEPSQRLAYILEILEAFTTDSNLERMITFKRCEAETDYGDDDAAVKLRDRINAIYTKVTRVIAMTDMEFAEEQLNYWESKYADLMGDSRLSDDYCIPKETIALDPFSYISFMDNDLGIFSMRSAVIAAVRYMAKALIAGGGK